IEADPERMDNSRFDDLPNIEMMREFKERYKENDENPELFAKQFNPYVKDPVEPIVLKCKVKNKLDGFDAKAKVQIEFFDPGGIDYIKIKNKDQQNSKTFYPEDFSYDDGVAEINKKLQIDGEGDYWYDGWDFELTIVDTNGNVIQDSTHVKSELGGLWQDFTDWITNVVWGAVDDAVSTASDMADSLKYTLRSFSELPLMEDVRLSAQTITAMRRNMISGYFELNPFPTYYQGPTDLCAALCCKMTARYYGHDATIEEINKTCGDDDVYDGMTDDQVNRYLNKTGFYEDYVITDRFNNDMSFSNIINQLEKQKDPIIASGLKDFYEAIGISSESHDVVIVGYYEDDDEKGVVIADSNIAVTGYTYMVPWNYLKSHLSKGLVFTDGNGMAG
ncbi:MAG: C39 family peptidase, partial [Thermoplasmatota archaeon]